MDSIVIKEGFLEKLGGKKNQGKWQKRWFRLSESTLKYGSKQNKLKTELDLSHISKVEIANNLKDPSGKTKDFGFLINYEGGDGAAGDDDDDSTATAAGAGSKRTFKIIVPTDSHLPPKKLEELRNEWAHRIMIASAKYKKMMGQNPAASPASAAQPAATSRPRSVPAPAPTKDVAAPLSSPPLSSSPSSQSLHQLSAAEKRLSTTSLSVLSDASSALSEAESATTTEKKSSQAIEESQSSSAPATEAKRSATPATPTAAASAGAVIEEKPVSKSASSAVSTPATTAASTISDDSGSENGDDEPDRQSVVSGGASSARSAGAADDDDDASEGDVESETSGPANTASELNFSDDDDDDDFDDNLSTSSRGTVENKVGRLRSASSFIKRGKSLRVKDFLGTSSSNTASSEPIQLDQEEAMARLFDMKKEEEEQTIEQLWSELVASNIDLENDKTLVNLEAERFLPMVIQDERKKKMAEYERQQRGHTLPTRDHCRVEQAIISKLKKDGDKGVYWSDWIGVEVPVGAQGKKNETQLFIMVIGHKSIYFVDPATMTLVFPMPGDDKDMRIQFKQVSKVLQNGYDHGIVSILMASKEYDLVLHFDHRVDQRQFNSLLPNAEDHKRTPYQRKIEFLDHLSDAFFACYRRQVGIFFVADVMTHTRRNAFDERFKPEPDPIDPHDILHINSAYDFAKIINHPKIVHSISAFGDREILLSCVMYKRNRKGIEQDRYLVITDCAMYIFKNFHQETYQRRLELDEVGQVVKGAGDKEHLLVRAPNEYDIYFKTHYTSQIEDVFRKLFQDDDIIMELEQGTNLLEMAQNKKTEAFKLKMRNIESLSGVLNELRKHISTQDTQKIKMFVEYAHRLGTTGPLKESGWQAEEDPLIKTALQMLKQMKEQELIKYRLQHALEDKDVITLLEIKKFTDTTTLKVFRFLREYAQSIHGEFLRILAEKVILKRIDYFISQPKERRSEEQIQNALHFAIRAGFKQQAEEYKQQYDIILQREYCRSLIEECVANHDADRLLLLLENAEKLGIAEEHVFKKAKQFVQKFIEETQVRKEFLDAVRRGREEMREDAIKQVIRKYTKDEKRKNEFSWIVNDAVYKKAKLESKLIKERIASIQQLDVLVNDVQTKLLASGTAGAKGAATNMVDSNTAISMVNNLEILLDRISRDKAVKIDPALVNRAHQTFAAGRQRIEAIYAKQAEDLKRSLQKSMEDQDIIKIKQLITAAKQQYQEQNSAASALRTTLSASSSSSSTSVATSNDALDPTQAGKKLMVHPVLEYTVREAQQIVQGYEEEESLRRKLQELLLPTAQQSFSLRDIDSWETVFQKALKYSKLEPMMDRLKTFIASVREQNELRKVLNMAMEQNDSVLLDTCLKKAQEMPLLKEDVERANKIFDMKRQQANIIKTRLKEAMRKLTQNGGSSERKTLQQLIQQAESLQLLELDSIIIQAKKKLISVNSDELKEIQRELDHLCEVQDLAKLSEFLNRHEDVLPSALLKKTKALVNKLRKEQQEAEGVQPSEKDKPAPSSADSATSLLAAKERLNRVLLKADTATSKHRAALQPIIAKLQHAINEAKEYESDDGDMSRLVQQAQFKLRELEHRESLSVVRELHDQLSKFDSDDEDDGEDELGLLSGATDERSITSLLQALKQKLGAPVEEHSLLSSQGNETRKDQASKSGAPSLAAAPQFIQSARIVHRDAQQILNKTHPLIEKLHAAISMLTRYCASIGVDDVSGRYRVDMANPLGHAVIRALTDVFADHPRKRFLFGERLPVDIFAKIPTEGPIQQHMEEFFVLDVAKDLQAQQKALGASADKLAVSQLLLHYLVATRFLNIFVDKMLSNDAYVKECYDTPSLLRVARYRDDLYSVLSLLSQFDFEFQRSTNASALMANPISKLKTNVRTIIQLFVSQKDDLVIAQVAGNAEQAAKKLGNDLYVPELGKLVRVKLCSTLLDILTQNFRGNQSLLTATSRLFGGSSQPQGSAAVQGVWSMFEEAANLKRISAVDLGGLALPGVIDTVNRMYSPQGIASMDPRARQLIEKMQHQDPAQLSSLKFQAFVCHALNEGSLSSLLQTILIEKERLLRRWYYDQENTIVLNDDSIVEKLVEYLRKLDVLPFSLNVALPLVPVSGSAPGAPHQQL